MTRNGLILLQVVGGLSILPYPVILIANIMSIAAPGHNAANSLPWILLSFYPLVWIVLYVISWRAMAHGSVGLAFALSSIPAAAVVIFFAIYLFSWIGFGLGMAGIGKGGLHSTVISQGNPVVDSIMLASQDIQPGLAPGEAVEKALHEIDANPALLSVSVPIRGTPLNAALSSLSISLDGTINGDRPRQQERIRMVRALVAHGAHLSADESTDLRKTWTLRRALYEGEITTSTENPLVWRIVTHNRGESKPFNPLTDQYRRDEPQPFALKPGEEAMLNKPTAVHGTPLYAALLDNAKDVCAVIIQSGGRLSPAEAKDPAASSSLRSLLETEPGLRASYEKAP